MQNFLFILHYTGIANGIANGIAKPPSHHPKSLNTDFSRNKRLAYQLIQILSMKCVVYIVSLLILDRMETICLLFLATGNSHFEAVLVKKERIVYRQVNLWVN